MFELKFIYVKIKNSYSEHFAVFEFLSKTLHMIFLVLWFYIFFAVAFNYKRNQ